MINLPNDYNKIKEVASNIGDITAKDYFNSGTMSTALEIDGKYTIHNFKELGDIDGIRYLYIDPSKRSSVFESDFEKCIIVPTKTIKETWIDTRPPQPKYTIIYEARIQSLERRLYMAKVDEVKEMIVYESFEEVVFAQRARRIEFLKKLVKQREDYLKDPWKEYRAKEDHYKKSLEKARSATEYKIKETKEEIVSFTNEIKKLENEYFLPGKEKENREDN